jgi:hypothetical protein
MESVKLYLPHGIIVYNPKNMTLIEGWGFNIEEELHLRGIKYNPSNYFMCGWVPVFTNETLYKI